MDSDPFDDVLTDNAAKNARAGAKFQPKAKPKPKPKPQPPRRDSAVTLVPCSQQVRTTDVSVSEFSEPRDTEKQFESDDQRNYGVVNASSEHADTSDNVDSVVDLGPGMNVFMPDSNEDWHSCFEKSVGENADIFIGLESLGDFLPDTSSVLDNADPSAEAPTGDVPGSRDAEGGLSNPLVRSGSASLSNIPSISSQPEISTAEDPLTGVEHIVSSSAGGCHVDNKILEAEERETHPCLETLQMSESKSRLVDNFQRQSKMQTDIERSSICISDLDVLEPVPSHQDTQLAPSEIDFVDRGSVPAFTRDDVLDVLSVGLSRDNAAESTTGIPMDNEQSNLMAVSHVDAEISRENLDAAPPVTGKLVSRRAKSGKHRATESDQAPIQQGASTSNQADVAGRLLRKRQKCNTVHQLVDEPEDEPLDGVDLPAESPGNSAENKDDNSDGEFQLRNESRTKRVQKNSNKPPGDKEKPVRKQKKDNQASDQAAKAAPKKFSRSTRRRKVDKALLENPDEVDFQKVPLRDLIALAEYKERMAKKEATTSQAPPPNESVGNRAAHENEDWTGNAFQQYDEGEHFASEQGGEANDEEPSPAVEENSGYFNYHTYMVKTPKVRWSKQDTELFYAAVRQFGTEMSMIVKCFPGRTRKQVKLKYKKEERQHPMRLHEALTNRAKDYSYFEHVIEHLQQMAAEEKQNGSNADTISLTGEEEAEEGTPGTNDDEEVKSGQINEDVVEDVEPKISEDHSSVKSYDSDDDLFRWSQYKSEV